ncbi:uncharacterized protein LOC122091029 [Macadamia integrifolia]|uniref:uncharacterized protein LOC122091029 n=1 Tax=Macadamia integrifolia TaxID=60698 RepID=UPI001C4FB3BE|nr:uncharacterized protein LOC122091029 [Macadamia integrifolia]
MELQSVCSWRRLQKTTLSNHHFRLSQMVSATCPVWHKPSGSYIKWGDGSVRFGQASKSHMILGFKRRISCVHSTNSNTGAVSGTSNYEENAKLKSSRKRSTGLPAVVFHSPEAFRGKPGSVSFHGLTYQLIEERKLVSSPFKDGTGSFIWVLAPVALISSLLLPQTFLISFIDAVVKDEILAEIVSSFFLEAIFYIGVAAFLLVADHVQGPYLEFSVKRWGLITGLRGYLTTAFFTMGFKVVAPLLAVYVTWPMLGLPALVAVAPFLIGCAVQFAFEVQLSKRNSSCWPLVPIIFEVYRLYQLTKSAHFIEKILYSMKDLAVTPKLMERSGALVALLMTFQVLGVVCLWSLMTFLLRLFPSRPVSENY